MFFWPSDRTQQFFQVTVDTVVLQRIKASFAVCFSEPALPCDAFMHNAQMKGDTLAIFPWNFGQEQLARTAGPTGPGPGPRAGAI